MEIILENLAHQIYTNNIEMSIRNKFFQLIMSQIPVFIIINFIIKELIPHCNSLKENVTY